MRTSAILVLVGLAGVPAFRPKHFPRAKRFSEVPGSFAAAV